MPQKESEWEKIQESVNALIKEVVSQREKEIAEEVESMALDKVGDSEATRKQILQILKH